MLDQEEKLLEYFTTLPEIIQAAVLSDVTENYVLSAARKYNLSGKDIPLVLDEVTLTLLGLKNPKDLEKNLREAGFSGETISKLAQEIQTTIFRPLGKDLSGLFEEENVGWQKFGEREETKESILGSIEKSSLPNISLTSKTIFEQKLAQTTKFPQTKEEMLAELRRPEGSVPGEETPLPKPRPDLFPNPQKNIQTRIPPPHEEKKDPYRELPQ